MTKKSNSSVLNLSLFLLIIVLSGCTLTTENTDFADDIIAALPPWRTIKHIDRDVVYASPDSRGLTLDVFRPDRNGPLPMFVWVHGGNYNHFSKESGEGLCRYVAEHGYVVFNINYRKVPQAHLKEIVEDVMSAVIWAKDHAEEYNGDPLRLAIGGHSAGAHMAEIVTVACNDDFFKPSYNSKTNNDCCPAAAVLVSGYYEFEPQWENWNRWLIGAPRNEAPELYKKLGPASYDLSGLPPHLVVFGEKDMHRERGIEWARRLDQAKVKAETYMAEDSKHHWIMWHWKKESRKTYQRIVTFLDRHL